MQAWPVSRRMVMARLRRLAMTRGPFRVRIWEESSPRVTSRTQCRLSSMDQCPRKKSASWAGLAWVTVSEVTA